MSYLYRGDIVKKKLIYFSDQQVSRIQKDADEREISFTEMVRRILDRHYEDKIISMKRNNNEKH
jgi:hypothetical protein